MNAREKLEFEMLCQSVLEGSCADGDFEKLEARMDSSPECRALFRETFLMHEMLLAEDGLFATGNEVVSAPDRRRMWRQVLAAAAVILLAGVVAWNVFPFGKAPTLRIVAGPNSKYVVTHGKGATGGDDALEPGAGVTLSEGTLELEFSNGVQSIVQAPASFILQSAEKLSMEMGIARFRVPE
ncbi:MAG: hypothetical protein EOP87_25365, partial [Verrucomicrobiaceae bacterium]